MKTKFKQRLVMVTYEFGNPVFIAATKDLQIQITDKIEDAEIWNEFDGTKLPFHKAITGYNGLQFISI